MNIRKISIVAGSFVLIVGISWVAYRLLASAKEEEKPEPKTAAIRFVKAQAVQYSTIVSSVNATGRLLSVNEFDLSTEVGGQLVAGAVKLKKGEAFRKGQTIARVFNEEADYALKARKSRFLNSLANLLPDIKIDYPKEFDKWQGFFDKIDIDKRIPELPAIASNQEKIFLATRNILSDYYSIRVDEVRMDKFNLVAPFDGSFSDVFLEVGSVVNPGSRIAHIIQTTSTEAEVPLDLEYAKWVRENQTVKLFDGTKRQSWEGRVVRKSNFIDSRTQSISIFVLVTPKAGQQLYPGMYLYADFPGIAIDNVMEIPRNALYNQNQVHTVVNELLKTREVKVAKVNETTVLISGLEPGEMVIVEPIINATEGSAVKVLQ